MPLNLILQTVIPVFLIILVGCIIGKYKRINIQPITDLIVYIAGPCLIFSSVSRSSIDLANFAAIALSAAAIIAIMAFLAFLILKITKSKKTGLYLPMTIGNTGYIGYPIALFAFGADGLSRAIIFDITGSLFLFSAGIYIAHKKNELKEVFKVPLIYAVVIGILFNISKIAVPELIFKPIEMIGMIAIPAALLVLGYKLMEVRLRSVSMAILASLFKIFIGFLAALLVTGLFPVTASTRSIILLQASMPSAVMAMIICSKYNRDAELVASVVLTSTIMSFISIPSILAFLA